MKFPSMWPCREDVVSLLREEQKIRGRGRHVTDTCTRPNSYVCPVQ